jgi:hypothetical protein
MAKKGSLQYCWHCKEDSVITKHYIRKEDKVKCCVYICLNKSCASHKKVGYTVDKEAFEGLKGQ